MLSDEETLEAVRQLLVKAEIPVAAEAVERMRAENAALRAQLATAQRREAEARAVLEEFLNDFDGNATIDKARAWLAAGAPSPDVS